jgi:hypothetical protein
VICGINNEDQILTELQTDFNIDNITHTIIAEFIKSEYQNRQQLQQCKHRSGGMYQRVYNRQDADKMNRKGMRAYGHWH